MYEWETKINEKEIAKGHIYRLQKEIKRISDVILRGNFSNPEDKEYWIKKLTKLNGELLYWESI